jgi:hypothetical protein
VALGRSLDVIGELHSDRDDELEVGKRSAAACRAGREMVEEDRAVLGHEDIADPAVRELTRSA